MTGYDPFAYGQVRLNGGQSKPQGSPDDILFADAGPLPGKASPAKNSDWDPVEPTVEPVAKSAPMPAAAQEFASEVLGEAPQAMAPQFGGGGNYGGVAGEAGASFGGASPTPGGAAPRRPRAERPAGPGGPAAPARPKEKLAPARRPMPMQLDAQPGASAAAVPLLVIAAGTGGAAWAATAGGMPVMAALVGAATLIAAAFARISLTR
ncbi:MAG: hypothetical protein RL398_1073 [Planctomycetota bacterium]|jgi:hypothetical protein